RRGASACRVSGTSSTASATAPRRATRATSARCAREAHAYRALRTFGRSGGASTARTPIRNSRSTATRSGGRASPIRWSARHLRVRGGVPLREGQSKRLADQLDGLRRAQLPEYLTHLFRRDIGLMVHHAT